MKEMYNNIKNNQLYWPYFEGEVFVSVVFGLVIQFNEKGCFNKT